MDVLGVATRLEEKLAYVTQPITIAVMGCVVNGPGEAREADIGVAGGRGSAVIFRKGEIVRKVGMDELEDALMTEINQQLQPRLAQELL